jgi:hypothetical protein
MATTKIVELFIDDDYEEAGIEAISLVSRPAHDEGWLAFNSQKKVELNEEPEQMSPYTIVSDDFCQNNPKLQTLGEPYSQLINEGWQVVKVEKITPQMVQKMNQQRFSDPNGESELDTEDFRVRFKYVGPKDDRNRQFCADMMSANRVYRFEDIDDLTDSVANPEFGFYNIFMWRGSFNCRHSWVKLLYKPDGSIRNTATSVKGLVDIEPQGAGIQPDTRNDATARVGSTGVLANGKPATATQISRDRNPRIGDRIFTKEGWKEPSKMVFGFDDEKKIVVGAAMVPNRMIHRYDDLGNLYYVFFSKESIKKMSDKFLKERRTDETNIEHDGLKLGAEKVFITESWVSEDPVMDKSHFYGFDLPSGTWFVAMKVNDPKIWKMIKEKNLTGFSVEGLFAEKSIFSKEDKQINQITKILKSIQDYE